MRHCRVGLIVAALLATVPSIGWGQSNVSTGLVLGGVTRSDGEPLAGVTVEARSHATGLIRRTVADADGRYRIDLLPPGRYDVQAGQPEFRTEIQRGTQVGLGSRVRLDFILSPSVVEAELVVTADIPLVGTTDPTTGATVGDWAIANLPLQRRNFTDFVLLTPGTASDRFEETPGGRGSVYLGARQIQNSYNIDGANNQSAFFGRERGGTLPPFTFSQASIQEFQVLRSAYDLQYSSGGGVINAITKSGSNEPRGEVFGFVTSTEMVSRDALGRKEEWEQIQLGFAFGGPVVRDRLHFFVSLDMQEYQLPHYTAFRGFPDGREPDWEARSGLDFEVETSTYLTTNDALAALLKLDWQLAANHWLTARYNGSNATAENQALSVEFTNVGLSNNGTAGSTVDSLVASVSSVLAPDLVNEGFVQYAFETRPRDPNSSHLPETVVLDGGIAGSWGQRSSLPNAMDERRLQLLDTARTFFGTHAVKLGFEVSMVEFDNQFCGYCSGSYAFAGWDAYLDGGAPWGYRQGFSQTGGAVTFDGAFASAFAADEWRPTERLTVTYGLRYEAQRHDQPAIANPLSPDTGRIPNDADNWAPRAGFAWDIGGNGVQVVRGGLGRYYDWTPTVLDANAMLTNGVSGFLVDQLCFLGDECPAYPDIWREPGDLNGVTPSIFVFDPRFENPETDRFSIGYEREVDQDMSVGVDLLYSKIRKLERKQDRNIVPSDGTTTPDGRPVYGGRGHDPDFDQIIQFTSDARAESLAVMLRMRKRFSRGWSLDASYTWSDASDNDSNERSVSRSDQFPEDQFNLDGDWGPSAFDVRHRLVASFVWQLPLNFQVAAIGYWRTGFPYSAGDRRDNNGDSYSNERALVETSPGRWIHYDRNTERQPDVKNLDLRLSWTARLGAGLELELLGEVFNLTDETNWYNRENRTLVNRDGSMNSSFGEPDSVGAPRRLQLGARLRF